MTPKPVASSGFTDRDQYDKFAPEYDQQESQPTIELANQLISIALGDCTDLRILDLGGGNGVQARQALAQGAAVVDVIDISKAMLEAGERQEKTAGRQERINYFAADAAKPFDHLGLRQASYDVVMANWLFDHATSLVDLEGMWHNISTYAKDGARFIGVRMASVDAASLSGEYGTVLEDVRPIPDGYVYRVVLTQFDSSRIEYEGTSITISLSGSTALHKKYGFSAVEYVSAADAELVRSDPDYWKLFLQDPFFVVVTAVKVK